ncbi:TetR/AcrR family transcriptional regulator [Chengkuizengella sediminis]|uniref:TetR/AcrR family transcriptional regulator n=1 Tax=Chengkuizengella sediminis TaxID=1885917 RepID=UPI001389F298|nr:TetR/AcrR family transcriptional regulator [Chengkuizengella sediminis]NDI35794.1 TetR/AcrR family transcriptional regulator [Chengkuizengella sediminis]
MPRTPETNDQIRRETSEKILKVAMELFIQNGYHSTSIDEIANKAKISKGLLYHYYKGKESLLAAMVEERIEELLEVMETATTKESPVEQISYIIEGSLENVSRKPKVFRFYLNLLTQPKHDKVLAKYSNLLQAEFDKQFEVQNEMFEKLGVTNAKMKSVHFSSTLQGIMLMYSTYPYLFPLDEIKAQVIDEFCR